MATLYLCGAGNPEGVRLALVVDQNQRRWDRIVLLDDDPAKLGQSVLGVEVAGPFALLAQADPESDEVCNLVSRTADKRWAVRCKLAGYGLPFATLIHPSTEMAGVEFGMGPIVYQHATIGPQVKVGEASVIFMGAAVGHESQVGRGCIMAPGAIINARVQLGDGAYVGSNATVLPEVKVGPWATIGAGSAVMRDVPAGATVLGVPAKMVFLDLQRLRRMSELEALTQRRNGGKGIQADQFVAVASATTETEKAGHA